jgi:hypothetical protein
VSIAEFAGIFVTISVDTNLPSLDREALYCLNVIGGAFVSLDKQQQLCTDTKLLL